MCQKEKTTKKKQILDPNNPDAPCHLDKLKYDLLFFLAKKFGYHDRTTSCSCKNKKDHLGGHSPIQLPFALGEISKIYLGSGVEECLANIERLTQALIFKGDKRIPSATIRELMEARNTTFLMFRAVIWGEVLVWGNTEIPEDMLESILL